MSTSCRALLMASFITKLLFQFQRPSRSGVWKLSPVCRLSANRVSWAPLGRSTGACSWWNVCWFWYEKPGDHVIDGVMFTGDGVRLTLGKFCVTRPLPISWRRLPRSEEHTSELQSQSNLVCRLLLE